MPDLLVLNERIVEIVEFAGVLVILGGGIAATATGVIDWRRHRTFDDVYRAYRRNFGRAILLGLEFLIAADIISTVAIHPSGQDVLVLGGIVLIRTFLSFALDVEITGRWPWRRAEGNARDNLS